MKYSSFERLVLVLGGASVLATLALTYRTAFLMQEVIAQLLLFGVLFAAVHWGRRGGFFAALIASVAYIAMRIPLLDTTSGITTATFVSMLTRVLAYGLIGILGGELCTRMKYVLAGLEESAGLDSLTGIYSEHTLAHLIDTAQARFERYQEQYCLIVLRAPQGPLSAPTTNRERALVKQVAGHIRSDIRLVDEAGRTNDGRFIILLPHSAKGGGDVVTERLAHSVRSIGGGEAADFACRCLGAAEDAEALAQLRAELEPALEGGQVLSPA